MTSAEPIVLGFDTSTAACRVAVLKGEQILAHRVEEMAKGQAERLMMLCSELIENAGLDITDLTAIGVGIGPGNFTGIRISVSAARGLALGLKIPAIGVSAFDALRFGQIDACACAVDARRDEVYLQSFYMYGCAHDAVIAPADALPSFDGPLIGHGGKEPMHPTAIAICKVASARSASANPRPAPFYLRPADAAPARDAAPTILS